VFEEPNVWGLLQIIKQSAYLRKKTLADVLMMPSGVYLLKSLANESKERNAAYTGLFGL